MEEVDVVAAAAAAAVDTVDRTTTAMALVVEAAVEAEAAAGRCIDSVLHFISLSG